MRISQDLHTRTSKEHPTKNLHINTNADDLQDLNARNSWGGCQPDLHKIFSQGPARDHAARTPIRFHRDLVKSFSRGLVQNHPKTSDSMPLESAQDLLARTCEDLDQDLHTRTPKRRSQDRHKRTCGCRGGSYKSLIQEPPKSLPQELSYKHL